MRQQASGGPGRQHQGGRGQLRDHRAGGQEDARADDVADHQRHGAPQTDATHQLGLGRGAGAVPRAGRRGRLSSCGQRHRASRRAIAVGSALAAESYLAAYGAATLDSASRIAQVTGTRLPCARTCSGRAPSRSPWPQPRRARPGRGRCAARCHRRPAGPRPRILDGVRGRAGQRPRRRGLPPGRHLADDAAGQRGRAAAAIRTAAVPGARLLRVGDIPPRRGGRRRGAARALAVDRRHAGRHLAAARRARRGAGARQRLLQPRRLRAHDQHADVRADRAAPGAHPARPVPPRRRGRCRGRAGRRRALRRDRAADHRPRPRDRATCRCAAGSGWTRPPARCCDPS